MSHKSDGHVNSAPLQTTTVQRKVDVILPIYGSHSIASMTVCIESLLLQSDVAVSPIVAYQDSDPRPRRICNYYGIQCVPVSRRDAMADSRFVPAAFRNAAIRRASGEYVYNGDADIVYMSRTFFADLIDWSITHASPCVYAPPMRRIPVDIVARFVRMVEAHSLSYAIGKLFLDHPFVATLEPASHRTIVFRDNRETGFKGREPKNAPWLREDDMRPRADRLIVYLEQDYYTYRSSPSNAGKEPYFCTQDVHCGGTLAPRETLLEAGGFCEKYIGWGCHDMDLQAKLDAVSRCTRIPLSTRFCVLHMDHERAYFDDHQWRMNRRLFNARTSSITYAIETDRRALARYALR